MSIEINNVSLAFTGKLINDHTPLLLEDGGRYCVKSPSGTGKSTFLHVLYGLIKEYEGTYRYQNTDTKLFGVEEWSALRKNSISMVFQGFRLLNNVSAMENLRIKNSLTNHVTENVLQEYAQELDIATLLNKKVSELSFGQQQRVAILRALCQPFRWILLDEPFAHLDSQNLQRALHLILHVTGQNKAGIIIADTKSNPLLTNFQEINLGQNG